ncbi:MAG TPA: ABC transporter permease [Chloroflexi bacterium]|nr:ABC transporter permease [Chloroflexota bacterium]
MIDWGRSKSRSGDRHLLVWVALGWLGLVMLSALLAPLWVSEGDLSAHPTQALLGPRPGNPLGTDFLGRDVLLRLVWGGRLTLLTGLIGVGLAVGLGLPVGLAAGSLGGWVDRVLMRVVDALLSFPGLLLAMTVVAIMGAGIESVALAVGLAAAPSYARLTRSLTLEVRVQPYVEAARSVGCSPWRIVVRHILPNTAPALVAFAATQLGWVLLNGAALNFLGVGVPPGAPEWGAMLAEGRPYLRESPGSRVFRGMALTLTVLAANLAGDSLQR